MEKEALLPFCYFAPVQWYGKILTYSKILLEVHETYPKQTYRNRCAILGANGPLNLSVPVVKPNGNRTKTKEIEIDYRENWQTVHWRSIVSAYKNSPFFEFYADDLEPLFKSKYKYLIELNAEIHSQVMEWLALEKKTALSPVYIFPSELNEKTIDFREIISPKKTLNSDPEFTPVPYRQVFMERQGFIPNLSILDLLFNKGQESILILKECITPEKPRE